MDNTTIKEKDSQAAVELIKRAIDNYPSPEVAMIYIERVVIEYKERSKP
jgi:hypothetical protein